MELSFFYFGHLIIQLTLWKSASDFEYYYDHANSLDKYYFEELKESATANIEDAVIVIVEIDLEYYGVRLAYNDINGDNPIDEFTFIKQGGEWYLGYGGGELFHVIDDISWDHAGWKMAEQFRQISEKASGTEEVRQQSGHKAMGYEADASYPYSIPSFSISWRLRASAVLFLCKSRFSFLWCYINTNIP